MKKPLQTFKSLVFELHHMSVNKHKIIDEMKASGASDESIENKVGFYGKDCYTSRKEFKNGFGVSVLLGENYYSNGIDTYEVAILRNGEITYTSGITGDVLGRLTEVEVSAVMIEAQELEEGYELPSEDI